MDKTKSDRSSRLQNLRAIASPENRCISMIEPSSVADLLKAPIIELPKGKRPVRLLACGKLQDVNSVIHQLHVLHFTEVIAWTPPVPSLVKGEVIRVLTRHVNIMG
jgi:hypothetical protein